MNRPAYVYLLWVGGDGKVAPVYPWRPGDWHNRPQQEQPIDHLSLPPELDRGWPMGGGAGMESDRSLGPGYPLAADGRSGECGGGIAAPEDAKPRLARRV